MPSGKNNRLNKRSLSIRIDHSRAVIHANVRRRTQSANIKNAARRAFYIARVRFSSLADETNHNLIARVHAPGDDA